MTDSALLRREFAGMGPAFRIGGFRGAWMHGGDRAPPGWPSGAAGLGSANRSCQFTGPDVRLAPSRLCLPAEPRAV